jgi:hypothetical protein
MARSSPIQASFNGGEWSPLMYGRVDYDKYQKSCRRMENFLPTIEGPAFARQGFVHLAEVKNSAHNTILVRFEFSSTDSLMLEFGDGYIRFYKNRARVTISGVVAWASSTAYVVGDIRSNGGVNYYCKTAHTSGASFSGTNWHAMTGNIYEIPSPYAHGDLIDDGVVALRVVQTGDVIRFAHRNYAPYTLSRYGATNWVMQKIVFSRPPFKPENITTTTVYSSATTGTVTLHASANLFSASHVGQYFLLRENSVRDIPMWEPGVTVSSGVLRRSSGNNYLSLTGAKTGGEKPVHTEGSAIDGDSGVTWQYQDSGYGYVRITAYTSQTEVTAEVISQLPDGAVTSGKATKRWAFEAWNATDGYPTCVTFYKERCVYARDSSIWFSVTADFDNFATEINGVISADAGFERTLSSDRNNEIKWLSPGEMLIVGTIGDEWTIQKATTTDPFGPANAEANLQSTYGSNGVCPVQVSSETLFVQKSGKKIRSMQFEYNRNAFIADNISKLARHITGNGVVCVIYQQEPWSVVWCVLSNGEIGAMTYDIGEAVFGWHNHSISGAQVKQLETISASDGSRDDLYCLASITINGTLKRYISYLADEITADSETWILSDMATVYDGAPVTAITGANYLEGKEVWVLADGARHPNRTVTSGGFSLQVSASRVVYGLPCYGYLETLDFEGGAQTGTSQGKIKRAHQVVVRVNEMLGGKAGPNEGNLQELKYRQPSVPMGSAPPAYTGDITIDWPGDYSEQMRVLVVKDRPMPITVVAIMPQIVVQEGR